MSAENFRYVCQSVESYRCTDEQEYELQSYTADVIRHLHAASVNFAIINLYDSEQAKHASIDEFSITINSDYFTENPQWKIIYLGNGKRYEMEFFLTED